jgi:hypothetical protein
MSVDRGWAAEATAGTMDELLRVLRVSDWREQCPHGIAHDRASGLPVELLVIALAELPGVEGLDALRVSRRVVEVLTGARWHMMRQAREEGASWSEVGQALGMSRQAAHDFYRRRLARQRQGASGLHDAVRSRTVLREEAALDG